MKIKLRAAQGVGGCVVMSSYQLRIKQALCIVKVVLCSTASLLTRHKINSFSSGYYSLLIGFPKDEGNQAMKGGMK